MPDDPVGLDPDLADAYAATLRAAAERFDGWQASASGQAAAVALTADAAAPGAALAAAAGGCRSAADDLTTRASLLRGVAWSPAGATGVAAETPLGVSPLLAAVGAALGLVGPSAPAAAWGWGGPRPAGDDEDDGGDDDGVLTVEDLDLEEVARNAWEAFRATEAGTYGVCAEVSAGANGTAGELGACAVSTPDDAGVIVYTGLGRSSGTASVAVAAGTMASNADQVSDLEGPAVCMSGTAAMEAAGVTGTMCASIRSDGQPTGVYVLSAGVAATSPGASGSISVVDTEVAFTDGGALRIIRTPIEAVEDVGESFLDGLEDDLESLTHWFWR